MKNRGLFVLTAAGGLLAAGYVTAIVAHPRETETVKVVFENAAQAAPAGPEPLFPGQPTETN